MVMKEGRKKGRTGRGGKGRTNGEGGKDSRMVKEGRKEG
jgi:hypothetical protein